MTRYLFAVGLVLASCATAWHAPMPRPGDTLRAGPASARKIKAGTVIYQLGAGNVADVADNRKAGQRQGTAATAPDVSATNSSKRDASAAWWAWLLVAAAWEWLSHQLPLGWLRWRGKNLLLQKVSPTGQQE